MREAATLSNWTPKRAHNFSVRRLAKIEELLEDIAYVYGDVDAGVVEECDEIRDQLPKIRAVLDEALAEGRSL